jgi:hypothetical protein
METICGNCINMRDDNGYCGRITRYVNFFDEAQGRCFVSRDGEPGTAPTRKRAKRRQPSRYDPVPSGMQYCPRCGRTLPKDAFGACLRRPNGRAYYCKECALEYQKEYRARMRAQMGIEKDRKR